MTAQERAIRQARAIERDMEAVKRRVLRRVLAALAEARRDTLASMADARGWRITDYRKVLRELERVMEEFERVAADAVADGARQHAELARQMVKALGREGVSLAADIAVSPDEVVAAYATLPEQIRGLRRAGIEAVAGVLRRTVVAGQTPLEAMMALGTMDRGPFAVIGRRAEAIVRTELHRISQLTSEAIMRDIDRRNPGWKMTKTWLTTIDGRERRWHASANLQTVRVGEPYTVDGELLRFPGDPAGSGKNVINCRCISVPGFMDG